MEYVGKIKSPIGVLTASSDGESLTGLWMSEQKYFGSTLTGKNAGGAAASLALFDKVQKWIDAYFAGKNPRIDFPIAPAGSDFRKKVWKELCAIPYGRTVSYGDIAKRVSKKGGVMSAQAVGGAVGHNPISIIVPCHRVVGARGSLVGYGGGIKVKVRLLELEGVDMGKLTVPKKGTAL